MSEGRNATQVLTDIITDCVCICIEAGDAETADKIHRDMLWKIAGASQVIEKLSRVESDSGTGEK